MVPLSWPNETVNAIINTMMPMIRITLFIYVFMFVEFCCKPTLMDGRIRLIVLKAMLIKVKDERVLEEYR
jgi:hypothetical protein